MSSARSWLADNQELTLRVAGSLAFVTAAGGLVAFGVRAYVLAAILSAACSCVTIAFIVARAVLVRAPRLGALGVSAGVVSTLLLLPGPGFWPRTLSTLAWLPVAWVAWTLLRRPVAGPLTPALTVAEAAPPPEAIDTPATPRPRAGEPGFEYASPPRS